VATVAEQPKTFTLQQNFPNPFNPETSIAFTLPVAEQVTLTVYNINGNAIRTLADAKLLAGRHSVSWNGLNDLGFPVSSGVYICRMEAGDFSSIIKMSLFK
jgi:flagellar hook assembly protein FlgD